MRDHHDSPEAAVLPHRPDGAAGAGVSAPASRLSLLHVNFQEIYERHLCRHSEYGLNVNHILAVVGSYLGLFGVAGWLLSALLGDHIELAGQVLDTRVLLLPLPVGYLIALAMNVPVRLLLACIVFTAAFFAAFFALPPLPLWLSLVLIPASHFFQQVGHKIWVREHDMTRFKEKYPKGRTLFLLLSLYELPILLNYLVFDVKSWSTK